MISIYAPQSSLDESHDDFLDRLINVVWKLGEKETIAWGFNNHDRNNLENYKDQHGGYDYGVRNKEGETILELWTLHCASCSYEDNSREYTFELKGKLPSHSSVWSIKNSVQL